ncbi:hypothetical protein HD553DRAFT_130033 [Filobasidium floriforme]|uniref:uncharacterized protein n=1 Tax=Filobasidium floriforme TaxID=5210 RepID=UPI001E8E3700|nr:uncharacterized protein HD553DRAFT_130033 [Filobasidium floriforme]KAH8079682.1 hypothetical protein HD553DRAFT_130033 [Filobasidium floriforme]
MCEGTKVSCPVFGRGKTTFECVDIANRLESCGGCISAGQGRDCSEIEGADQVSCRAGDCVVQSCMRGFEMINNSCLRKSDLS